MSLLERRVAPCKSRASLMRRPMRLGVPSEIFPLIVAGELLLILGFFPAGLSALLSIGIPSAVIVHVLVAGLYSRDPYRLESVWEDAVTLGHRDWYPALSELGRAHGSPPRPRFGVLRGIF